MWPDLLMSEISTGTFVVAMFGTAFVWIAEAAQTALAGRDA